MSDPQQIGEAINEVVARINGDALEPSPRRRNWAAQREPLRALAELLERKVLEPLEAALAALSEDDRETLRFVAASVGGATAAVLFAAGDRAGFSSLLSRASAAAGDTDARHELAAATRDPDSFVLLAHARWLRRRGKVGRADRLLRRVSEASREPVLREIAQALRAAPSPIKSAPSLFTLNGCGISLHGSRDKAPDGSYVATTYLTLVFIPLLPLASYRVVPQGGRSYLFLGRVPLWRPLQVYRTLVAAAVLLGVAGLAVNAWLESPTHRLALAIDRAQAAEKAGRASEAIAGYSEALATFESSVDTLALEPAAEGWLRLRLASFKEPFTPAQVDEAARVVLRFQNIGAAARAGAPTRLLVDRLGAWGKELKGSDAQELEAAAQLAELGLNVAGPAEREAFQAARTRARTRLARALEADWPIDALAQWALLGNDPSAREGIAALAGRIESDDLLLEAQGDLERWFGAVGKQAEAKALVDGLKLRLAAAQAREKEPGRAELLDKGDEKALGEALKKDPKDVGIAVALSGAHRARGDAQKAIALLESLGKPGWLIAPAQRLLATCHTDIGKLEKAEALLERFLSRRLPRFQAARLAYQAHLKQVVDQAMARAQSGGLPADLDRRIEAAPEAQRRELFDEWLSGELDKDAELIRLRDAYQGDPGVVPASIALGMVKLRRANAAEGDARAPLLKGAERAFLAIRQEAEGSPEFHLGLGQVFHRLGKPEEGDKELAGLVASQDFWMQLKVAKVYRELGLVSQARQAARAVFDKGGEKERWAAASTLSVIAVELEEREEWLTKAGSAPFVKLDLAETRGRRLLRDGKPAEADRELAVAAAGFARDAAHDPVAANNAALAYGLRFVATGDPAHLEKEVQMLESALRLAPDNALILGNLAGILEERAVYAVLHQRIHLKSLPLGQVSLDSIVDYLLDGPDAAKVAAELRADPHFRRALELTRQEEVLAPKRAQAYDREQRWFNLLHDEAGLKALGERLERVGALDTTQAEEARKAWDAGSKDEQTRARAGTCLKALAKVRTQEAAHAPTVAVASLFEATTLQRLALLDADPAQAHEAVLAWRRAEKAWPALAPALNIAGALLQEALLTAAKESPDLAQACKEHFRALDVTTIAWKVAAAHPPAREALRGQPSLQEAAKIVRGLKPDQLGTFAWVVGWLAGDAALQAAAAGQLKLPQSALEEEVATRLSSNPEALQARRELLAAARAP